MTIHLFSAEVWKQADGGWESEEYNIMVDELVMLPSEKVRSWKDGDTPPYQFDKASKHLDHHITLDISEGRIKNEFELMDVENNHPEVYDLLIEYVENTF